MTVLLINYKNYSGQKNCIIFKQYIILNYYYYGVKYDSDMFFKGFNEIQPQYTSICKKAGENEKMIHTYSVFLSVSQRQDSLYVQEEFASVE